MAQTANAATELAREHEAIEGLTARIGELEFGADPERMALIHEVCARFAIHLQAEERYLQPALRRLLPDAAAAAVTHARRDRAVCRTIERVESGSARGDEFDILVGQLVVGMQEHVERQDAVLLPVLVDVCSIAEINRLGERLREGMRAAREAAGQAAACEGRDPERALDEGEPGRRGFKALLRRMRSADRRPRVA